MTTPFIDNIVAALATTSEQRDNASKLVDHARLRMIEIRDRFSGANVRRDGRSYALTACVASRFPGWQTKDIVNVSPVDNEPGIVRIETSGAQMIAASKIALDQRIAEAFIKFMAAHTLRTP